MPLPYLLGTRVDNLQEESTRKINGQFPLIGACITYRGPLIFHVATSKTLSSTMARTRSLKKEEKWRVRPF